MTIKFLANTSVNSKVYRLGDTVRFSAADEGTQVQLGNAIYWPVAATVTPTTATLVQSGLPFVVPSTGTMGASGALSAITAIVQYPDCYMYFPATTFAAASVAGWYYTVMSSTTAGTVYANTYSSGTPTIPTTPVAIVGAGSSYTQTTGALLAGPQYPMTAGQMGPNGVLHITYVEANNNSAGTKTFATVLGTTSVVSNTATTTVGKAVVQRVYNAGKAAKQWTVADISTGSTATASSTEDTATALTIALSLQLGTATDTVQLSAYSISLLPS